MATSHSGNGYVPSQEKLSVSDVASLFHVSSDCIRLWEREGRIPTANRTLGNHRFFYRQQFVDAGLLEPLPLVETPSSNGDGKKGKNYRHVVYCRVSSESQKSSLQTQRDKIVQWIWNNYQIPESELLILMEVKSALNKRPQLLKILDLLVSDNPPVYWFAQLPDRISRMGRSEMSIWEHLCARAGTKLIFCPETVDENDTDNKSDLVNELFSVITYFTNKNNGMRSRSRTMIAVPPEHLNKMVELYHQGYRWHGISRVLSKEGIMHEKGRKYSHQMVKKHLTEYFKQNPPPEQETRKGKNSYIAQFFRDEIARSKSGRIFTVPLWAAFQGYSESKGFSYLPRDTFLRLIQSEYGLTVKPSSYGANAIKGIRFKRPEWKDASFNPYTKNKNHLQEISEKIRKSFS
jgi:predicted site-specific integrase-resolvase